MKVALTLPIISENEPRASTAATAYLHHHSVSHPLFNAPWRMPASDRLSRFYLLLRNIIPDCDEKRSFLWHWLFVAKCEFGHKKALHWSCSMFLCCWLKYPRISQSGWDYWHWTLSRARLKAGTALRNLRIFVHLMSIFASVIARTLKNGSGREKSRPNEVKKIAFLLLASSLRSGIRLNKIFLFNVSAV